jgi:hypothetical protein
MRITVLHMLLSIVSLALVVRMVCLREYRNFPATLCYFGLLILDPLIWTPTPHYFQSFRLAWTAILLIARVAVVVEWYWWATFFISAVKLFLVRWMGIGIAVMFAMLLLYLTGLPSDISALITTVRQYGYLLLATWLIAVQGFLWVDEPRILRCVQFRGVILSIYMLLLWILSTGARGGVAWLILPYFDPIWKVADTVLMAGLCLCTAALILHQEIYHNGTRNGTNARTEAGGQSNSDTHANTAAWTSGTV